VDWRRRGSITRVSLALPARRWTVQEMRCKSSAETPFADLQDPSNSFDYEVAKRAFDIVGAVVLLIASAPLLAAWYLWSALSSTGPVLIRQQRIGRLGRRFDMLKLRTLPPEVLATADRDWSVPAPSIAMSIVRQTGLDELPQLWNVLRGDMSLVGPRPERPYFVERFTEELPHYPARHRLHAGLTGWAQINGLRGDRRLDLAHDRLGCAARRFRPKGRR
jgi:lipopolysaccharide/colanic/teichoic acid biosynthesis glycosyltransferase